MPRLVRVHPREDAGISRLRSGSGFRYVDGRGRPVTRRDVTRIRALAIPPAWKDVWICADARGHIQAVGTDDAGRRQYLYHSQWRAARDRNKFARALALAESLPHARGRVTTALGGEALDRERVLAVAFRLLDRAAPRMGSFRYFVANGSRGLTTLRRADVALEPPGATLSFPGKSGKRAFVELEDDQLAEALAELARGRPRSTLLSYERGRRRVPLTPADVNAYVRELTGGRFTAKDFRTLRGTIVAAETLARIGPADSDSGRKRAEQQAVRATADVLGNTPAVARSSYIDPRIFQRYSRGEVLDLRITPESALRDLLEG